MTRFRMFLSFISMLRPGASFFKARPLLITMGMVILSERSELRILHPGWFYGTKDLSWLLGTRTGILLF